MLKDHISVNFSNHEKWELQSLMNHFGKLPQNKYSLSKNAGQQLKQDIMHFFKQAKKQLEDKTKALDWVKDFLTERKLLPKSQRNIGSQAVTPDQIYESVKKLRTIFSDKDRDSQCYSIYVHLLSGFNELTKDKLSELEDTISKSYKVMSFVERDNLVRLGKKLLAASQLERKARSVEEISIMFSKITRYGIKQDFQEIQRIQNKDLKTKTRKAIEYLQENCFELQAYHSKEQSIRDFLTKLSNNVYSQEELKQKSKRLPSKLKTLIEPIMVQLFTLRDKRGGSSTKINFSQGGFYSNDELNKVKEENFEQLISNLAEANKDKERLQNQLQELKWFLTIVSSQENQERQDTQNELKNFLEKHEESDFGSQLFKISERQQQIAQLSKKLNSLTERKERKTVSEHQFQSINRLKEDLANYKLQNKSLRQWKQQSIQQKINMLDRIQKLEIQKQNRENNNNDQYELLNTRFEQSSKVKHELQEKCNELEKKIESLVNQNKELRESLTNTRNEIKQVKQTNTLYERTLSQFQRQKASQYSMKPFDIEDDPIKKPEGVKENNTDIQEYIKKLQDKESELLQMKKQNELHVKTIEQAQVQIKKTKESKQDEISMLRFQLEQMNSKAPNGDTHQLQQQVYELATKNEQLEQEIQSLIEYKQVAQALTKSLNVFQKQSQKQKEALKQSTGTLSKRKSQLRQENEALQKQLQELKIQIIALVDKHEIALNKIKDYQTIEKQTKLENSTLRSQLKQLKEQSFHSERSSNVSVQEFMTLQNNCEQLRQFNDEIKKQYLTYKSQLKNIIKAKIQEELMQYREAEKKFRQSYKKLHEQLIVQKEQLIALKLENDSLKKRKYINQDLGNMTFNAYEGSEFEGKNRELQLKYQALKRQTDRDTQERQNQIANLKLTIYKLENQLHKFQAKSNDMHSIQSSAYEVVQLKERILFLEKELEKYHQINFQLKVQLERKEHEISRMRSLGPQRSF